LFPPKFTDILTENSETERSESCPTGETSVFDIPAVVTFRRIVEDNRPSCEVVRRLLHCAPEHQRREFEAFLQRYSEGGVERGNRYESKAVDQTAFVIYADGFEELQKRPDGDYWIVPIPIVGTFK
jgi:hypothetical protein